MPESPRGCSCTQLRWSSRDLFAQNGTPAAGISIGGCMRGETRLASECPNQPAQFLDLPLQLHLINEDMPLKEPPEDNFIGWWRGREEQLLLQSLGDCCSSSSSHPPCQPMGFLPRVPPHPLSKGKSPFINWRQAMPNFGLEVSSRTASYNPRTPHICFQCTTQVKHSRSTILCALTQK